MARYRGLLDKNTVFRSSRNYPRVWNHQVYHRILNTSTAWSKSVFSPDEQSPHNWWVEDDHHSIHSECGPCYTERRILSSITKKMKRYTIFFITVNAVHVSGGFSAACLLLPLAVAASKLDIYQLLCVQFWAPGDGRRNRLKHVEHWQ